MAILAGHCKVTQGRESQAWVLIAIHPKFMCREPGFNTQRAGVKPFCVLPYVLGTFKRKETIKKCGEVTQNFRSFNAERHKVKREGTMAINRIQKGD